MSDSPYQIRPSTKVADLLDAYPELEEILINMAPPFKKLKNPILRKSVAKVATLQQAAIVGRVDVSSMIDQLRQAVGLAPIEATETPSPSVDDYLGTAPDWFEKSCVSTSIDDRAGDSDEMAITRITKSLKDLAEHQVIELTTTFLPAPGIDVARARGIRLLHTFRLRSGACRSYTLAWMAPLITARDLTRSYGPRILFDGLSLTISEGDRIGVIGPNGAGKTTMLRVLSGAEEPDHGELHRRRELRVAMVTQDDVFESAATVIEVATRGAALDPERVEDETERQVRVAITLEQLGFQSPEQPVDELSGGWRKRLAIAAALAGDPEVLLLDEPTNHLDLDGILWLEKMLCSSRLLAYVVISHDRTFLETVANRVVEVAPQYPGGTFTTAGSYTTFLERRAQYLQARAQYRDSLANRVRRELEWLARGPKARTTKAQSRIDEAGRDRFGPPHQAAAGGVRCRQDARRSSVAAGSRPHSAARPTPRPGRRQRQWQEHAAQAAGR
jgi:ABC-type glutathione transport system ATPase component